ncbi:MAG: GNAT family N-acetyltransferase [Pseudonocardiaceae bacterium]
MDLHIRTATADDLPAMALADGRAFGVHHSEQDLIDIQPVFDPARFLLACDGDGRIVGITGDFPFTMTVPGGAALDVPGLSWVSVAVTHRRRGVLGAMMDAQHHRFVDAGALVSVLIASESGIYGRFGYGPATTSREIEIDRRRATFRAGVPDPGGVRLVGSTEARAHAPAVHERWRRGTPGALSRSAAWWDLLFLDRESRRGGYSALFFLAHPDGYASYRVEEGAQRVTVVDLVAATDDAHAALWRVLLGLDLIETVATGQCPPGDPLPFLLTDPRQVRTVGALDGMWVRLLDVPAALAVRHYAVEVDAVLEVEDGFLGRGGRFRLRGGPDGAQCERSDAPPDAYTDAATLGALYLGGHRASTLARADTLQAEDPALRRLDVALLTDREPHHGTGF